MLTANLAISQNPHPLNIGVGVEGGVVTGYEHTYRNFEAGFTSTIQYKLSHTFAVTLTSGAYSLIPATHKNTDAHSSIVYDAKSNLNLSVPVKLGLKIFPVNQFYIALAGGTLTALGQNNGKDYTDTEYNNTKLLLSGGAGYVFKAWDVGVRYENFSGKTQNQFKKSFGLISAGITRWF